MTGKCHSLQQDEEESANQSTPVMDENHLHNPKCLVDIGSNYNNKIIRFSSFC